MESFDLDAKLMQFGIGDDFFQNWCIKHSILGVQAFGSNGSGKSSSLRTLALKYLRSGYGFLILSVKSERKTWEEYCRLAGRSDDLVIIGTDSPQNHRFNFLQYLSACSGGGSLTSNLVNILKQIIRAGDEQESGKADDPFWQKSLDLLLHNTVSLCQLAYDTVDIQQMYDIVQSAPSGSGEDEGQTGMEDNPDSPFNKAFEIVRSGIAKEYQQWKKTWGKKQKRLYQDKGVLEKTILEKFPKARQFRFVEQFFFETFKTLSFKTKSIILLSLSSFLFSLLQEPIYSLFCSGKTTVTPEDALNGKIILLDIPTRYYHAAGRSAQLLFKLITELQWEKRNIEENNRPVCLWSDESSEFLLENDPKFQATARDCRVAIVYITQNVHQYYAAMSGTKSADRVASFLGTLNTKLFFSNSDVSTNKMASELIGDALFYDPSSTITIAEKFSQTDAINLKVDRLVRPEFFTRLKTGGISNNCIVEAYIHVQGDKLFNGWNYKKIRFNQNYK